MLLICLDVVLCVFVFNFLGQFLFCFYYSFEEVSLYILDGNSLLFIYIADMSPMVLIAFMLS